MPTSWGMESGLPRKSEFRRKQYDQITRLVPGESMAASLRKICPSAEITTKDFPYIIEGADSHKLWTAQFLWIHDHIEAAKKTDPSELKGKEQGE